MRRQMIEQNALLRQHNEMLRSYIAAEQQMMANAAPTTQAAMAQGGQLYPSGGDTPFSPFSPFAPVQPPSPGSQSHASSEPDRDPGSL